MCRWYPPIVGILVESVGRKEAGSTGNGSLSALTKDAITIIQKNSQRRMTTVERLLSQGIMALEKMLKLSRSIMKSVTNLQFSVCIMREVDGDLRTPPRMITLCKTEGRERDKNTDREGVAIARFAAAMEKRTCQKASFMLVE